MRIPCVRKFALLGVSPGLIKSHYRPLLDYRRCRRFGQVSYRTAPGYATGDFIPSASIYNHQRSAQDREASEDGSTIYALSTGTGRSAIAVVRISGPLCRTIYSQLCPNTPLPKARLAVLRKLYTPSRLGRLREILDPGALVLFFPGPNSVTGEDVLELSVHGGTAILRAVLAAIPNCIPEDGTEERIRYAEAGEFTRRAFNKQRLTLPQVEALSDTLTAETEQQRRLAVRGVDGALAVRYEDWWQQLLFARGELEAILDFSEEQQLDDSPSSLCSSVTRRVAILATLVQASIENAIRGEMLRSGINIALLGPPNVGKSSLLNCIVDREAAIVSATAGTTRDIIDVQVDIGGYSCRFGDLAGIRPAAGSATPSDKGQPNSQMDDVEREGIRRAKVRVQTADVIIVLVNGPATTLSQLAEAACLDGEIERVLSTLDPSRQKVIFVLNKIDLMCDETIRRSCRAFENLPIIQRFGQAEVLPISCVQQTSIEPTKLPAPQSDLAPSLKHGIKKLLTRLTTDFEAMTKVIQPDVVGAGIPNHQLAQIDNSIWAESLGASERQRKLLEQCHEYLVQYLREVGEHNSAETYTDLSAERLRMAANCLAKMTGRGETGDIDEVLGIVFANFCVGK